MVDHPGCWARPCAKGTAEFYVADNSDVQALASRLDAAEEDLAALERAVDVLTPSTLTVEATVVNGSAFTVTVRGRKLQPGSQVRLHTSLQDNPIATVASDGTIDDSGFLGCEHTNVYFTGVTDDGDPITSNVIAKGPGCP